MKISSITVQNFRCFGEIPETIDLSLDLTAFVGSNGSGKTAVMMALNRMFGATQSQRTIRRTDFHQRFGMNVDEQRSNYLAIEVKVVFPELEMDTPNAEAIPSVFNQMLVEAPGGELFNRLRLEAQWTNDGTSEGHVEQKLFWVTSLNDPVPNDKKKPLSPYHRGLIQVIYVPATRDPGPEIRNVARSRIGRLLNAISWDSETRDAMQAASLQMSNVLNQEAPVVLFNDFLQGRWDRLRDDYGISEAELRFVASDFQSVIRDFGITFKSQEHGIESDLSRLSEGQLSLFYLALVAAVFDVERQIISQSTPTIVDQIAIGTVEDEKPVGETNESNTNHGFKLDRFHTPALTVFAIEEPENHLAPHYLSRITDLLRSFTSTGAAQAVFSSHSASILRRIAPDEIRHLRLDSDRRAHATELSLPENEDEIGNFV